MLVQSGRLEAVGPAIRVDVVSTRDQFLALRGDWNQLAERCGNSLFLRHEYLQLWIDHFGSWKNLCVLVGRDSLGQLVAALPLLEQRTQFYGVPVRLLSSPTNEAGRFDLLAVDPPSASKALAAALEGLEGWDVLRLSDVPEGAAATELLRAASGRGFSTGVSEGLRSPFLRLPPSRDAFDRQISRGLRASLRRRRRRLNEKGKVELERVQALEPGLLRRVNEAFQIEGSGWKGKAGTAILQNPRKHGFYSGLALLAADLGLLALSFLRLDGRAIAFDLGLRSGDRYLSVKHGYDEGFRECSPGQLITEDLIHACIDQGLTEFDFMGEDAAYKRDWADSVRPHAWMFVFARSARARLLRTMKFTFAPVIKEALATWRS